MQQMSIIKNLKARSTYIHIPKWIDNELELKKGEEVWIRLEDNRIIIQREKPASNSEQGKGKHESA
ncbi:MAG: AbrB/MazE/SpoVT family DNA-binding domain-containing protein [Candidatus Methanoperedens sp.]|jgi:antitoxin component of MazEF toxin-antitoxin module|nr:AbrB/MazE/SpoVT family DNA-binding domain-containing protein [Candidatus Methanoperedens sp.]